MRRITTFLQEKSHAKLFRPKIVVILYALNRVYIKSLTRQYSELFYFFMKVTKHFCAVSQLVVMQKYVVNFLLDFQILMILFKK